MATIQEVEPQKPEIEKKTVSKDIPQVKFKPSIFKLMDMPATTGNINIICRRE